MKLKKLFRSACIGLFTICMSPSINAAIISAIGIDDDASLMLSLEDTITIGVNQKWGTVRINVGVGKVGFTVGDTVDIKLFEDDVINDDLLWQTSFMVTSGEVTAGLVDRTFDLIFTPVADAGDFAEIYADALVTKGACGTFCINDNPNTSNLNVALEPVPVPAAVWLFGSGLIGLVGLARRKKHS
jgi:hypothetical protein